MGYWQLDAKCQFRAREADTYQDSSRYLLGIRRSSTKQLGPWIV